MDTAVNPSAPRRALGIDIDRPFQQVLAAWLATRGYCVRSASLAAAATLAGDPAELVVCELAQPKANGEQTMGAVARLHPDALRIAISARFVTGAGRPALARQIG